ncbi:MAG: hypothetical protein QOD06_1441, partial [Candidatus Binatota bacterium]|nr:hypothetical protein [Candidatus Binatota bacterium]
MAEEHARPRRAPSAGDDPFDAGIRAAVFELNRLPGGATRSSCQGKTSPSEASTHADLAYVLFRRPMPLSLEEHLLHEVGGVARIE